MNENCDYKLQEQVCNTDLKVAVAACFSLELAEKCGYSKKKRSHLFNNIFKKTIVLKIIILIETKIIYIFEHQNVCTCVR